MRINNGRSHFYQWDLNQQLTADGLAVGDEVHFANATSTHALVVKAYEAPDGTVVADVPNALLREAYPIMAYRYITQGDSEHTVETTTFSVQKRPQPSDYIYSETEVLSFEQLIEQVKDALKKLEGFEVGTQVTIDGEPVVDFPADTYVQERLDALKAIIDDENAEQFDRLNGWLTETREELKKFEEDVALQNTADREEFDAIRSEVGALGEEVKDLDALVKHFDTDVQNFDTAVTNLDTKVTNLDTEVTNLETEVTNLETEVTNFGTVVANNNKKVVNLEAEVEAAKKALDEAGDAIRDDFAKADAEVLEESKDYTDEKHAEAEEALAGKSAVKVGGEVVQDFDADTKLDKVTNPASDIVYGVAKVGGQKAFPTSTTKQAWSISMRKENGRIEVGEAVGDADAVPLAQMREALTEKADNEATRVWLEILTKRVTNLEDGTAADAFIVDDTTAYIKDIPTDAASYAELRAVGGMTHKVTSDEEDRGTDYFDINALFEDLGDSHVAVDYGFVNTGMSYPALWSRKKLGEILPQMEVGKTYVIYYHNNSFSGASILLNSTEVKSGERFLYTEEMRNSVIGFGTDLDQETNEIYGVEYSDIHIYGYKTELLDTPVTALDITGKNLYNGGFGGNACATEENGVLTLTKTAAGDRYAEKWYPPFPIVECTIYANLLTNTASQALNAQIEHENGKYEYRTLAAAGAVGAKIVYHYKVADGSGIKSIRFYFAYEEISGATIKMTDIMILPTSSSTNTTYSPYHKTTFAIPAAVQALDGNGWGIPNGAVNGIEWNEGGAAYYVQRVARSLPKSSNFYRAFTSASHGVYFSLLLDPASASSGDGRTILCNKLPSGTPNPYERGVYVTGGNAIFFAGIDTIEEWKAQLDQWEAEGNPLTVYYELAEPIVTNVTRLFDWDNLIPVEGGGTITAVNEHNLAASSTIIYGKRGF